MLYAVREDTVKGGGPFLPNTFIDRSLGTVKEDRPCVLIADLSVYPENNNVPIGAGAERNLKSILRLAVGKPCFLQWRVPFSMGVRRAQPAEPSQARPVAPDAL